MAPPSLLDSKKKIGFKCGITDCGKVFTKKEDVLNHIKGTHKAGSFRKVLLGATSKPPTAGAVTAKKSASGGLSSIKLRKKEERENMKYRCHVCRLVKQSRNEIEEHCLEKHNQKTKWVLVNKKPLKKHTAKKNSIRSLKEEYDNIEVYMCPFCEFEDSKLDRLVNHVKIHTPDNLYEVSLRMQKQMKLKTFRCIVCFYRALKGSTLRKHIECHSKEDVLDRAMDFSKEQADDSSSEESSDEEEDIELAPQKRAKQNEASVVEFKENAKSKSDFVNVDVVLPKTFTCVLCSYLGSTKKQISSHIKEFHKIEMNEHLLDQTYATMKLESMVSDTPDKRSTETIALPAAKKLTTKPHQGRKESTNCKYCNREIPAWDDVFLQKHVELHEKAANSGLAACPYPLEWLEDSSSSK